jgi:hypothetical protein
MFPADRITIGQRIDYLSTVLLPAKRFEEYVDLMGELLDDRVHYIDAVHELHDKPSVLKMLAKYVPRAANPDFRFALLVDGPRDVIWKWTIRLEITFKKYPFTINGLVHAVAERGKIVYQREYYDPMESVEVIPVFGKLYKQMLQRA